MAGQGGCDPTERIYDCRYFGVGGTEYPAMILDRSHSDLIQVFPRGAGVSVPAVVRYIDQNVGPQSDILSDLVSEDRLITDECTEGVSAAGKNCSMASWAEEPDVLQK